MRPRDLPSRRTSASWLFQRMARLARALAVVVVDEYGTRELLSA
jgi:hypothetical protein